MWAVVREPCDENVIRSRPATAPCPKSRGRWVLAATILASSMAFIDGTVVNVALPALQTSLNATAVDMQWVIEAYSLLLSARAFQGLGAALLVPGSLAIISSSFSEEERGRAIGTWSGFSAITTSIGPVIGGWLIEHASWRAVFFINLPIG